MYKFNWVKYCKDKAGHGLVPLREKADIDGKEVAFGDDPLWGTCNGQDVKRDWCDFIPDAPSTFMVFDREVFSKCGAGWGNEEWAVHNYGRIMEFKGNSEHTNAYGLGFMRSWCRPLTLEDFKREKIAVLPLNKAEQQAFLQECENVGISWTGGTKATKFTPDMGNCIYMVLDYGEKVMLQGSPECVRKRGYTVVPFTSFSFPSEPPKPIPSRSIHITSDGLTTHATMKEGDVVVRRAEAKCNPTDAYSFQKGAETAFARLWDKPDVNPAPQAYMEVKRKAKVGEKIKIVNPYWNGAFDYTLGDVLEVVQPRFDLLNGVHCAWDEGRVRCVIHEEYVVLLPVRRVHRRAKVGEYVEILPGHGAMYPAGKILKCLKNYKNGDEVDKFSGDLYMLPRRYDVLEGCEEGAKWPEK